MDIIEKEIEKAKDSGAFLAELALALTIPSVCSKRMTRYSNAESDRYATWYNKYVYGNYNTIDGNECYALRCALLHNGNDDMLAQSVLNKSAEYLNNQYKLFIPCVGDTFDFVINDSTGLIHKEFCAAALSMWIMYGYQVFKTEFPSFTYPLGIFQK